MRSILEDEAIALAVSDGLAGVEAVMSAKGMTKDEIDKEFLYQALIRFWVHDDMDALKAQVTALASEWVDNLHASIGG